MNLKRAEGNIERAGMNEIVRWKNSEANILRQLPLNTSMVANSGGYQNNPHSPLAVLSERIGESDCVLDSDEPLRNVCIRAGSALEAFRPVGVIFLVKNNIASLREHFVPARMRNLNTGSNSCSTRPGSTPW